MKLNESKGRMFRSVDYTGTFFRECGTERDPWPCGYCLTKFLPWEIKHDPVLVQYDEHELLKVRDCTVFLNSVHDSFAPVIPSEWILGMLRWIGRQHRSIKIYLQSKYINRAKSEFEDELLAIQSHVILGTTIESNRSRQVAKYCRADSIYARVMAMIDLSQLGFRTRISHEPLQAFDLKELLQMDTAIAPELIELGLDNYQSRHQLNIPQPNFLKYETYVDGLISRGIPFEEKDSIKRWRKREAENAT